MKIITAIILFAIMPAICNADVPVMIKTVPPLYNYIEFHVREKMVESQFSSVGIGSEGIYETTPDKHIKKMHEDIKSIKGIESVHISPYCIIVRKAKIYTWNEFEKTIVNIIKSALSDNESHTTISFEQCCPWCGCTRYTDYYVKAKVVGNLYYDNKYNYSFSHCSACGKDYTCKVTTERIE